MSDEQDAEESPSDGRSDDSNEREASDDDDDSSDESEYVVEAIRKWTYHFTEKRRKYYVKWLGYPEDQNTWEPEEHLNCPKILNAFIKSLPTEELRYFYCSKPEKLTGFQRNAGFLSSVGVDGPHDSDDDEDSSKNRKNRLYILALFDDSDQAEEVTLEEFHRYQPEAAMQFCEERIMVQDDTSSSLSSSSSIRSCSPPPIRTGD